MRIERSRFVTVSAAISLAAYAAAFASTHSENVFLFTVLILSGMAIAGLSGLIDDGCDFFGLVIDDYIDYDELEAMVKSKIHEISDEKRGEV